MHAILRRSRMENEMNAELRFHIETYAEDLIRGGVPRFEAMRRARVEFGAIELAREECRHVAAKPRENSGGLAPVVP